MGWSASHSLIRTGMHILEACHRTYITGEEEHIYDGTLDVPQSGQKIRAIMLSARLYPDEHGGKYTFLKDKIVVRAGTPECIQGYVRIVKKEKRNKASIRDELHAIEELRQKGTGQTIIPPFYPSADFTIERLRELLAAQTSYHMTGTPITAPDGRLIVNVKERQPDPELIAELERARDEYEQRPSVFDQFFGKPKGPVINEERFAKRRAELEREREEHEGESEGNGFHSEG